MSEDCPHCIFEKTEANCRGCFEGSHYRPKPITNADRIRAMTDEELAKTLCAMTNEGCPPWHDADISLCHNHGVCHDGECWMKWLKQESVE